MGYSGAVSRKHSSGSSIRRGAITKTGKAHLRRSIIEAAWTYQHRPAIGARTGYHSHPARRTRNRTEFRGDGCGSQYDEVGRDDAAQQPRGRDH
jgi:transposase